VEPGGRRAEILERLAVENQEGGALLADAVLAAPASTDRGFARFAELAWVNPLVQ
jgi:hypothetical protein